MREPGPLHPRLEQGEAWAAQAEVETGKESHVLSQD